MPVTGNAIALPNRAAQTPPVGRYRVARIPALALALAIPAGAAALILVGDFSIRRDVGLMVAVAVVLLVAWLGGIWPALFAMALSGALLAGPLSSVFDPPIDGWSLFLFAVAGLTATVVVESLYRSRWGVEAARDRARDSRRAEHALRAELESIVGGIGDGILVADANGSVTLMNGAAREILGGRTKKASEFVDLIARGENGVSSAAEMFEAEGPVSGEFQLAAVDRRIEVSAFPLLTEGAPTRRVFVIRDVTEARRRDLLRDAFLSLLSHELRTPMTAVYGGATLLQRVGDSLDPATRNEIRADIVAEAERLSRLIDDLLVLTRVEGGVEDVQNEPALLQHIVGEVIERGRRGFGPTKIELTIKANLAPVKGDETSIRQVTHNLVSNAIKYSPPGSVVEVHIEPQPDEVQVRVLDRGRGLSTEEANHVFEPFYRARGTERLATGIGIGLFVSQRLVEAMGGRIWTRSRDGGGTEFGFALQTWPMDDPDEEPMGDEGQPDIGADPYRRTRRRPNAGVSTAAVTLYIDASLVTDGRSEALALASDLGFETVVVTEVDDVPETLGYAWHLTGVQPRAGSPRWGRTVLIGPRQEPGRVAVSGLRTARDLRLALLELASEHASD